MNKDELYEALNYVNATRENRSKMANTVEAQPDLMVYLVEISQENLDPISCKASWVLESVVKTNLNSINPVIDQFINSLRFLKLESSIRPASKICLLLVQDYFSKKTSTSSNILKNHHLGTISESAFDWLIGNHKVAPKAYSMTTLLFLGKKIEWIHPELLQTLKQNYENGSAAYKARARMTLKVLENNDHDI